MIAHRTGNGLASSDERSTAKIAVSPALNSLQRVEQLVHELTASWVNANSMLSRRFHRVTFRQQIAIAELCDDGLIPTGQPRTAFTTDISHGGLSFEHDQPLACRMIAVTLPTSRELPESFVMRLKWCRFTRAGIYRSGGKFIRPQTFGWEQDLNFTS